MITPKLEQACKAHENVLLVVRDIGCKLWEGPLTSQHHQHTRHSVLGHSWPAGCLLLLTLPLLAICKRSKIEMSGCSLTAQLCNNSEFPLLRQEVLVSLASYLEMLSCLSSSSMSSTSAAISSSVLEHTVTACSLLVSILRSSISSSSSLNSLCSSSGFSATTRAAYCATLVPTLRQTGPAAFNRVPSSHHEASNMN